MTAGVITVIAVVAGIAWLAIMGVSAVRNRGSEEVAPNLAPGLTNAEIETTRIETAQKAAIAFSAFLAISLPLYFLGEIDRQDAFVEEFSEASVARGAHVVEEYACFSCHGPDGVGGSAQFIEQRSGVTVSWEAPSLNDVLLRYDESEVNYWITYGRGNTPMPGWGLAGGGPLNEAQVIDTVNYLKTIQVSQAESLEEVEPAISAHLDRLANADATVAGAILNQRQVIAEIMSAPDRFARFAPLVEQVDALNESLGQGIDTDGDGVPDATETELSALTAEIAEVFKVIDAIEMDPETPDAELADEAVSQLEAAIEANPILEQNLAAITTALEEGAVDPDLGVAAGAVAVLEETAEAARDLAVSGIPASIEDADDVAALVSALADAAAEEGADPAIATLATTAQTAVDDSADNDGDGISNAAESTVTAQMAEAAQRTVPSQVAVVALDPSNPASVGGAPDLDTFHSVVGNLDSLRITLSVTTENQANLLATENGGLDFLLAAQDERAWEIDIAGVAESMGVSAEEATRAVGLFNSNCARCHTAGFSAGVPYTREAGSGGFGPALWDGRPVVQFGEEPENPEDDLLVQFLIRGSEEETPYGLNGFGSGRMPAFGAILSQGDIELLAAYLRSGNLTGSGEE